MRRNSNRSTRRAFLANTGKAALATTAVAAPTIAAAFEPPIQRARKLRDGQADANPESGGPTRKHAIPGSPSRAYSRAVQHGPLVFVAGCVGRYEKAGEQMMDNDFESQAGRTLMNLKASIEAAGSSMDRVLQCTCFLKRQSDFAKFNEVYMKFFPEPRPARSTVVVADFVVPGALLEVDCVCCVD
jgi:2-iminobutanoate/2-iminopropanoate deaminase